MSTNADKKFHLHIAESGILDVSSTKAVPAFRIQARISYYEKSSDGTMIGKKQTLDTTKGDLIAEIEIWEEEPKSSNTLKNKGSA
jgi:hypothetical protein